MLGLAHNTNLLVPYDPQWAVDFETERLRLAAALYGTAAKEIAHYGSTSVPGMPAKPILDILIGVLPMARWRECLMPLLDLGYDHAADAGVAGHHIFGRGRNRSERTHLVHLVEYGGPSWGPNLAFRDALRVDATLRAAYLAEKQRAMTEAPNSRPAYNDIKGSFIAAEKAKLST
ncbi:GrpB family protein [Devosia sp.]|uniref:GrpB family protein n=1 Tax=Devosia sp. TaxID=1871048 RepID=UPI003A92DBFF